MWSLLTIYSIIHIDHSSHQSINCNGFLSPPHTIASPTHPITPPTHPIPPPHHIPPHPMSPLETILLVGLCLLETQADNIYLPPKIPSPPPAVTNNIQLSHSQNILLKYIKTNHSLKINTQFITNSIKSYLKNENLETFNIKIIKKLVEFGADINEPAIIQDYKLYILNDMKQGYEHYNQSWCTIDAWIWEYNNKKNKIQSTVALDETGANIKLYINIKRSNLIDIPTPAPVPAPVPIDNPAPAPVPAPVPVSASVPVSAPVPTKYMDMNKNNKLIAIHRTDKYYSKPSIHQSHPTFYPSGCTLKYISKTENKLEFVGSYSAASHQSIPMLCYGSYRELDNQLKGGRHCVYGRAAWIGSDTPALTKGLRIAKCFYGSPVDVCYASSIGVGYNDCFFFL